MVIKCIKNVLWLVVSNHKKDVFSHIDFLCCFLVLFFYITFLHCTLRLLHCVVLLCFFCIVFSCFFFWVFLL